MWGSCVGRPLSLYAVPFYRPTGHKNQCGHQTGTRPPAADSPAWQPTRRRSAACLPHAGHLSPSSAPGLVWWIEPVPASLCQEDL